MKAFIAILLSYGCLALVAVMIFSTSHAYAAPTDAVMPGKPANAHTNLSEQSALG